MVVIGVEFIGIDGRFFVSLKSLVEWALEISMILILLSLASRCLMSHPESLMARVFQSHYFKNGDMLSIVLSNSLSYIWRSIFSTMPFYKDSIR